MALYNSSVVRTNGTTFPDGGIVSFLSSNLDEIDDSRLMFGAQSGINSMRDMAEKMASMGRNGDTQLVHARTDEIMVSPEILEENPRLALEMARAFDKSNVELDRYVVGNEANSINPMTGQREFFLKRFIKGVKKVLKAVAPIIVPLALNAIIPGFGAFAPVVQGAISGGVTSLVQGGDLQDALKGAALGGALGGLSSGIKGGIEGFKTAAPGQGIQGALSGFGKGVGAALQPGQGFILGEKADEFSRGKLLPKTETQVLPSGTQTIASSSPVPTESLGSQAGANVSTKTPSIFEKIGEKTKNVFVKPTYTPGEIEKQLIEGGSSLTGEALAKEAAKQAAASGGIRILPTAVAALTGAAALGLADPIPMKELSDPYDEESPSERRLRENQLKYRTGVPRFSPLERTLEDIMVPATQYSARGGVMSLAKGGNAQQFPRRTGYISGPGTETSDSIPAMLSDGEFVMNARAVRGAGGGSREKGVRRMYDMMRAFEGGAAA
tara:strand:+ start:2092 stop:3582 length:1491 start_codon:yes stop_codon:yes gene_type:complete